MPQNSLITVTDDTFAELVLHSRLPVVVDFWAEWCPPCRPVATIMGELAEEFESQLVVAKINSDENPLTTRAYRVMSMPTLLFFRDGAVARSIVGLRPKSHFRQALTDFVTPYVNH